MRQPLQHFHFWCIQGQPLPTWLFLKKSRTSLKPTVQSRSENALVMAAAAPRRTAAG
jgi:hypothetical protein